MRWWSQINILLCSTERVNHIVVFSTMIYTLSFMKVSKLAQFLLAYVNVHVIYL